MRILRSAAPLPLSLALLLAPAAAPRAQSAAAAPAGASTRPRLQGDAWRAAGTVGVCGKASYEFKLAGAKAGNESFETTCLAGGGYASSAHTIFTVPGSAIDIVTTLEVSADWLPARFTAKGQAGATEIEQSVQFGAGDTATITSNGQERRLPYAKGAAFLSQNIYHLIPFVVARYDLTAGGAQQITVFPRTTVSLERQGVDTVRPERVTVGPSGPPTRFTRYHLGAGLGSATMWFDEAGRMAVVTAPAQQFVGVRSDFTEFAKPLIAAISSEIGAAVASTLQPPDYSAPAGAPFTAAEVTIPVASYQLAGTLLLPKRGAAAAGAKLPAVVLITGSGQQSRDERLAIPGLEGYRPFRQIAETLAARGIAVLRVDDRGAGASTGQQTYNQATTADLAGDTRAQVAWLRARPDIDPARIALVGHSEGATIASLLAADDPRIAAAVMMAGVAKRGDSVLVDQLDDMLSRNETITPQQRAQAQAQQREAFQTLRAGGEVPGETRTVWMRAFIDFDPLPAVRRVRQPLLILQGALDRQVTAPQATTLADAARAAGNPDVTVKVFPSLNHLFLPAKTGAFSEYSTLTTTTIGPDVLGTLADWLATRLRAAR